MIKTLSLLLFLWGAGNVFASDLCVKSLRTRFIALELAPQSERYLQGLLAEHRDGRYSLSLGDYYFSGHRALYENLLRRYEVERILWAGELLVRNNNPECGTGVVVATINTSGFLQGRLQRGVRGDENDPNNLRRILVKYRPDLVTTVTQYLEYSDEYPHLEPFFREFRKRVVVENENVVHVLRDFLGVIGYVMDMFTLIDGAEWYKHLERVSELFPPERLEKYLVLLETLLRDPARQVNKAELKRVTTYLRSSFRGGLTRREFEELTGMLSRLRESVNNISESLEVMILNDEGQARL